MVTRTATGGKGGPRAAASVKVALPPEQIRRHRESLTEHGRAAGLIIRRMTTGKRTLMRDDLDAETREEAGIAWHDLVMALWESLRGAYNDFWFLKHGGSGSVAEEWWTEAMPAPAAMETLEIWEFFSLWPDRLEAPHCITAEETALVVKFGWPPRPFPLSPERMDLLARLDQRPPW